MPGNAQHVSLDDYKKNLTAIIQHPATKAQNPKIILITPAPINEYQLESFDASKNLPHPSRTASRAKLYAEAVRDLAASLDVPVVDLWTACMASTGWKEGQPLPGSRDLPNDARLQRLLSDGAFPDCFTSVCPDFHDCTLTDSGLHLTPDGYKIMYNAVMQTIRTKWPEQDPEKMSMVYPGWLEASK